MCKELAVLPDKIRLIHSVIIFRSSFSLIPSHTPDLLIIFLDYDLGTKNFELESLGPIEWGEGEERYLDRGGIFISKKKEPVFAMYILLQWLKASQKVKCPLGHDMFSSHSAHF